MSKILFAMLLAATMLPPFAPARGADPEPKPGVQGQAEEAFKEGAEKIMRALELMMRAIPQYEAPEVLDNGDIIIRRRKPGSDEPEPPATPPDVDETAT